jgi:hypothetical protein
MRSHVFNCEDAGIFKGIHYNTFIKLLLLYCSSSEMNLHMQLGYNLVIMEDKVYSCDDGESSEDQ